jgi:hypothetical protein
LLAESLWSCNRHQHHTHKKNPHTKLLSVPRVLQDLQGQIWSAEFLLCSHARNAVVVVVIVPQGFEVILKEFS